MVVQNKKSVKCAAQKLKTYLIVILISQNKITDFFMLLACASPFKQFNPFKPEFTIVIFIHYKPQIAVAILDL